MNYTKGEWEATPFEVVAGSKTIADCVLGNERQPNMTPVEKESNIRLTSAAPELYESLVALKAQASGQFHLKPCGHDFFCGCAWDAANKALAKAEGRK